MAFIKASTNNPLGHRPWNAILQPGGLGAPPRRRGLSAFFPNAEAIGPNAVMVDRDASNPGWKRGNNSSGADLAPRVYYPPDALKQFTTARTQGLGDVSSTGAAPVGPMPARLPIFARMFHRPTETGASYVADIDASGNPVYTVPPPGQQQTGVDAQGNPVYNGAPQIIQATTESGAPVSVATSPVPAGTPTTSTYTDASGNVWAWNGSAWAITTAAASAGSLTSWLSGTNATTGLPNYAIAAGVAFALILVMKKK